MLKYTNIRTSNVHHSLKKNHQAESAGFSVVRSRFDSIMQNQTLIVDVEGIRSLHSREFVWGRDILSKHSVRVTLKKSGFSERCSLSDQKEKMGKDSLILFTYCNPNRNGTWEAWNSYVVDKSLLLTEGWTRVCAPIEQEDGRWSQSVQHINNNSSRTIQNYEELRTGILEQLQSFGPGRNSVIVRGIKNAMKAPFSFDINQAFDSSNNQYLDAQASFDIFLAMPDIWILGSNRVASGMECMKRIQSLMQAKEDYSWEIMLKKSFSLGARISEEAGLGIGKDLSLPFRLNQNYPTTGYLPCILTLSSLGSSSSTSKSVWPQLIIPMVKDKPTKGLLIPSQWLQDHCGTPRISYQADCEEENSNEWEVPPVEDLQALLDNENKVAFEHNEFNDYKAQIM